MLPGRTPNSSTFYAAWALPSLSTCSAVWVHPPAAPTGTGSCKSGSGKDRCKAKAGTFWQLALSTLPFKRLAQTLGSLAHSAKGAKKPGFEKEGSKGQHQHTVGACIVQLQCKARLLRPWSTE